MAWQCVRETETAIGTSGDDAGRRNKITAVKRDGDIRDDGSAGIVDDATGNFAAENDLFDEQDVIGFTVEGERSGGGAVAASDRVFADDAIGSDGNAAELEVAVRVGGGEADVADRDLGEGDWFGKVGPHEAAADGRGRTEADE